MNVSFPTAKIAALFLVMSVLIIGSMLILRGVFGVDRVWLHDMALWTHALAMMIGIDAVLASDRHIRIDLVCQRFGERLQRKLDFVLHLLLLVPALALLIWLSVPYAWRSIQVWEAGVEAGGLSGLFLIKSVMAILWIGLLVRILRRMTRAGLGKRSVS